MSTIVYEVNWMFPYILPVPGYWYDYQYSLQYKLLVQITGTCATVQFTGTVSSVQRYLIIALIIIGTGTGTVGSVQSYR